MLAVIDGIDGAGGDSADWAGALITMAPGSLERPVVPARPAEPAPPIAPSRTAVPALNYPRVTGAPKR